MKEGTDCHVSSKPPDAAVRDAGKHESEDAGPTDDDVDASTARDASVPEPTPTPVTFTLRNDSPAPIYVGEDRCSYTSWLLINLGEDSLAPFCACACGDASCECAPCAGAATPSRLLMPGQTSTLRWDGTMLRRRAMSCSTGRQLDRYVPSRGAQLTATICWNNDNPSSLSESTCKTQSFAYGEDSSLLVTVSESSQGSDRDWMIYARNDTLNDIEIVTERCGAAAWVTFEDEHMSPVAACPCACDGSFEKAGCGPCEPCAADRVAVLKPGGEADLVWDGRFWFTRESGCSTRYRLPDSYPLRAKVCWRSLSDMTMHCTPIGFQHGSLYKPQTWGLR